eukprot:403351948
MEKRIDEAKKNMKLIVEDVKARQYNFSVRVAIVAYRDLHDFDTNFEILDFVQVDEDNKTSSYRKIDKFLSELKTYDGDDFCEDVIGGMKKAIQILNNIQGLLLTFFIGDSPSHGKQYHDLGKQSDNLYEEIQPNTLENLMSQYKSKHKKQYFICLKIAKYNDKMYEIMGKHYGENFQIAECYNVKDFLNVVLTTSRNAITTYQRTNHIGKQKAQQMAKYLDEKIGKQFQKSADQAKKFDQSLKGQANNDYFIVKAIRYQPTYKSIMQTSRKILNNNERYDWRKFQYHNDKSNVELRISKEFDSDKKGTSCSVFKGYDRNNCTNIMIKLPLVQLNLEEQKKYAKNRQFQGVLAYILSRMFRIQCVKFNMFPPLTYVMPIRFELEEPFKGFKHVYGEIEIEGGDWKKHTNNAGYTSNNFYPTISHFTYEFTKHVFMLTDIQGEDIVLSDPAFHSEPFNLIKDLTNLGKDGIMRFFGLQHLTCNTLCQKLKLGQYDLEKDSTKVREYEELKYNLPSDTQLLMIACDICTIITFKTYIKVKEEIEEDGNQLLCHKCASTYKIFEETSCGRCKRNFNYNRIYWEGIQDAKPGQCQSCVMDKLEWQRKNNCYDDDSEEESKESVKMEQAKQSSHRNSYQPQNTQGNQGNPNYNFNSTAPIGYYQPKKERNEPKQNEYRPNSIERNTRHGHRGNSMTRTSRYHEETKQPSVNINIPADQLHNFKNGKLTAEEFLQQLLQDQQQQTPQNQPSRTNNRGGYRGKNFIPGFRGHRGRGRGGQ